MSRSTHMYISSLLSSFHLVNSCSVCPSDDMDKLNISNTILKNVYNYILQNLLSRFKYRSTKCQSTTQKLFFLFKICNRFLFFSCFIMLIVEVHLAETSLIFFLKRYPIKFRRLEKWKYTLSVCSSLSTVGSYSSHWTSALCKVEDGYIAATFYKRW